MTLFVQSTVICALFISVYARVQEAPTLTTNNALDLQLYKDVIDVEECDRQLAYITEENTLLRNRFVDASFRPPRSILRGNTRDNGNYFQCLEISHQVGNMSIEGKYTLVNIPLGQDFELPSWPTLPEIDWPDFPWPEWNPNTTHYTPELVSKLEKYESVKRSVNHMLGSGNEQSPRTGEGGPLANLTMALAFCVPKVCTPKHAVDVLTRNITATLDMYESVVRLPNDKPWVAADYVATILFSFIGLLTIISTGFDVRHKILLKRDPKTVNKKLILFSIYTNTKNFFVFTSNPNAITCLDGIRSFAMMWVIVGHTFVTQLRFMSENPLDIIDYIRSFEALWITSATITVDTFFMISGMLVVYTTAAKVSKMDLVKNLHLFYLNRILRMLPVLAVGILIEASFLHRTADGPNWTVVESNVNNCRIYWWTTLLFVQNLVNPLHQCLGQTWYLAVDMQLHIASPIVLFFILGQKSRVAWAALTVSFAASVAGATSWNIVHGFQSAVVSLARPGEGPFYMTYYYLHTLNRISPFIVGMMVGYLLHIYRGRIVKMHWVLVCLFWIVAAVSSFLVIFATYFNIQPDWDNQTADNLINSTIRPVWAASVGWLVFACAKGYGGIVNWILSLHIFKILGRLSYAMYIIHYPLIFLHNATNLQTIYFSVQFSIFSFIVQFTLTVIAAFLLTIAIDAPFTNIIKMYIGGGVRQQPKEVPIAPKEPEMGFRAVSVIENVHDDDLKKTRM